MTELLDLEIIENDDTNPIDEIMASIEKYSLENNDFKYKDSLERKILFLERKMQKAIEENESEAEKNVSQANKLLKEYYYSTVKEQGNSDWSKFSKSIDSIISFIDNNSYRNMKNSYAILSPLHKLRASGLNIVGINDLQKASTIALTHFDIANNRWISYDNIKNKKKEINIIDFWQIELEFNIPIHDSHKPLEFVYQFIEILSSVKGVKVELEEIIIGSLKVKLKTLFEEATSKEEVKELLESSKKFAIGKLEKEFYETELLKEEAENIEVKKQLLLKELEEKSSIDTLYKKSIEIQLAEEELSKKRLENQLLQLELMKKSTDTFSELLANGIISQNQFNLYIQGIKYLTINKGKLISGENIDVIDNM